MKTQRGLLLSSLIVFFGAAISLATILLIFDQNIRDSIGGFPSWFTLYLVVTLLMRLIALYAIWNLRRLGVYGFLLLECLEVSMGIFIFTGVLPRYNHAASALPLLLIISVVWYLALKPQWYRFK